MRMRCVVVTVLAAGCGGSSPTSGGGSGNPPAPTATVSMSEYRFAPETLRVAVGSVVGWSNSGTTSHTGRGAAVARIPAAARGGAAGRLNKSPPVRHPNGAGGHI